VKYVTEARYFVALWLEVVVLATECRESMRNGGAHMGKQHGKPTPKTILWMGDSSLFRKDDRARLRQSQEFHAQE
jgi:hypothetical protein